MSRPPVERRRRQDRRSWTLREKLLAATSVVALLMAVLGGVLGGAAQRTSSNLRDELAATTALDLYQGCRRGNAELRPAVREVASTLRDLVRSLEGRSGLPPTFAEAQPRLAAAIVLLRGQDCRVVYPAGYAVWLARDRPPAGPGVE